MARTDPGLGPLPEDLRPPEEQAQEDILSDLLHGLTDPSVTDEEPMVVAGLNPASWFRRAGRSAKGEVDVLTRAGPSPDDAVPQPGRRPPDPSLEAPFPGIEPDDLRLRGDIQGDTPADMRDRAKRRLAPEDPEFADRFLSGVAPETKAALESRVWSVNLERFEAPEDLLDIIRTVGAVGEDPKIVVPWEQTRQAAAKLAQEGGLTERQVIQWAREGGLTAAQLEGAGQLFIASTEDLAAAARHFEGKKAAGLINDADRVAFSQLLARHHALQLTVSNMSSEAGRILNYLRSIQKVNELFSRGMAKDFLEGQGGADAVDRLITALSTADTAASLNRTVKNLQRPGAFDMFYELWLGGLLSGIRTHGVNIGGSGLMAAWHNVEMLLAGAIGDSRALIRAMAGKQTPDHATLGEMIPYVAGELAGMVDGLRLGAKTFKEGVSQFDPTHMKVEGRGSWTAGRQPKHQAAATVENFANAVGSEVPDGMAAKALDFWLNYSPIGGRGALRMLAAEDDFFKSFAYRARAQQLAYRQASQEARAQGLKGAAASDFVGTRQQVLLSDMSEPIHEQAMRHARNTTFTQSREADTVWGQLDRFAEGIRNFPLLGKFIVPFKGVLINLTRTVVERTPGLALIDSPTRAALKKGGAARDEALARMAGGAGILTLAGTFYGMGFITGSGPSKSSAPRGDRGTRDALQRLGHQGRSIRIPAWYSEEGQDIYINIERLDPMATFLVSVADALDIIAWAPDEATAGEMFTDVLIALADAQTDKTFMRGIAEFFDAWISDRGRFLRRWSQSMAGSMVPTLLADFNKQFFDDTIRQVDTIKDAWRARMPWVSRGLPPTRDIWGFKMKYEDFNMLVPSKISFAPRGDREELYNQLDMILVEHRMNIRGQESHLDGINLKSFRRLDSDGDPQSAFDHLIEITAQHVTSGAGKTLPETLMEIVQSPMWDTLTDGPDGTKTDVFRNVFAAFRQYARAALIGDIQLPGVEPWPELADALYERQSTRDVAKGRPERPRIGR